MAHDASYGVTVFDTPPQQVRSLMEEYMLGLDTLRL
ncbi:mitochondrial 28S ribosomal protein S6 [Corchorus olitorius]|uniref:Mitochondrial 28S ribosomal protein S6 n=1 Tax=Corchorus olitorius TaxID=93759 RepID=A0A1R3K6J5_9ROSI|nr:mitochondrial 28S ribosomal protein S6 [Corchorus olitorius]